MKKIHILLWGICIAFCAITLAGCQENTYVSDNKVKQTKIDNNEDKETRFVRYEVNGTTFVFIDKETNVQYLEVYRDAVSDAGVAITPLYNKDGSLYSGEKVKANRFLVKKLDSKTLLFIDKETKVQYLEVYRSGVSDDGVAITPLFNKNGSLKTDK